jgi:hypothetical protein
MLKDREARDLLDNMRVQLDHTFAERQRIEMLFEERESEHQQMVAERRSDREQMERELAEAAAKTDEYAKALADRRVELQSVERNARNLELLAAAGRLALDIGRELQSLVNSVDVRAKLLLDQCSLESADREEIEALRSDVIRAASLARQIVQIDAHADDRSSVNIMTAQVKRFTVAGRNE